SATSTDHRFEDLIHTALDRQLHARDEKDPPEAGYPQRVGPRVEHHSQRSGSRKAVGQETRGRPLGKLTAERPMSIQKSLRPQQLAPAVTIESTAKSRNNVGASEVGTENPLEW